MAAATAYYSRELAYLKQAQTDMRLSNFLTISDTNVGSCAGVVADNLIKFKSSWDYQDKVYKGRKSFTDSVRTVFGDLDTTSSSFRRLGVLPLFIVVGAACAIAFMIRNLGIRQGWFGKAPGGVLNAPTIKYPFDIQYTIIRILGIFISALMCMTLSWTYGIFARYEQMRLNATLNGSGEGIFKNAAFGKILQGCQTTSLRQSYNCALGLPMETMIDDDDVLKDIKDSTCKDGVPSKLHPDKEVLKLGLQTLVSTDLTDFDAVSILRSIHTGISFIRSAMAPKSTQTRGLSLSECKSIVMNKIVPLMMKPEFQPANATQRDSKQTLFSNSSENIQASVYTIVLENWPHLTPTIFMDEIDTELTKYYDKSGMSGYYQNFLRDHVISIIQDASDKASESLKNDGRFASMEDFKRNNWPKLESNKTKMKQVTASLFINICRYTKTFVKDRPSSQLSMSSEMLRHYINIGLLIIVLFLIIYLVYMLGIKEVDKARKMAGSLMDDVIWYDRMDIIKYVLGALSITMFVMTILVTIKKKSMTKADHNSNTLYNNSVRLKGAAWELLQTINKINCKDYDARYRKCNKQAFQVCDNGGKDYPYRPPSIESQSLDNTKDCKLKATYVDNVIVVDYLKKKDELVSTEGSLKNRRISANKRFLLLMQNDGNLVLHDVKNCVVVWESKSGLKEDETVDPNSSSRYYLKFQDDGALVVTMVTETPIPNQSPNPSPNQSPNPSPTTSSTKQRWSSSSLFTEYKGTAEVLVADDGSIQFLDRNGLLLFSTPCVAPIEAEEEGTLYRTEAHAFYANAMNVINSYEKCNLITQTSKVPFPFAEFIVYVIFLILSLMGLAYITAMTSPMAKTRELRDLIRLREKLMAVVGGVIPTTLGEELMARTQCGTVGADLMRILTFIFVVIVFVLNIVLIIGMQKSTNNYTASLHAMASDMCV